MLHSFHWVLSVRSCRQVERNSTWHECNLLKYWSWSHAPDRETNRGQVEVSTHDCTTNLCNNALDSTSKIVLSLHIIEWETTVLVSIGASVIVIKLQWLEVLGSFDELLDIQTKLSLCFRLMRSILHCSEDLLYYLLLLILRQIIFEWKVLRCLQSVDRIYQVNLLVIKQVQCWIHSIVGNMHDFFAWARGWRLWIGQDGLMLGLISCLNFLFIVVLVCVVRVEGQSLLRHS